MSDVEEDQLSNVEDEDQIEVDTGADENDSPKHTLDTSGRQHGLPSVPKSVQRRQAQFSSGRPPKHDRATLMKSEGIIVKTSGTNKFASQKGQTSFGTPRITDVRKAEVQDQKTQGHLHLSSGTNIYASQAGMHFGAIRDVNYKTKGTGGAGEVSEEKAMQTNGIIPAQMGSSKFASQKGQTMFGMPRVLEVRKIDDQTRDSQGFLHMQCSSNKFASQKGMTGFGMPRLNISTYVDEVRGEMPHDESSLSRQTSGYKEGCNQSGMAFGAFRNNTALHLLNQDQASHGLLCFQYGVNFLDSQAGKTAFGMPRRTFTPYVDDNREDIPATLTRAPDAPFWSSAQKESDFANQSGMTSFGTPRDVKGLITRRLW
uniref:Calponin-like protein OV9M n=1 Tax=Rhabditophanes sp. KR3021 TaxID=114890 RepID=A0AC35UIK3_9BILA